MFIIAKCFSSLLFRRGKISGNLHINSSRSASILQLRYQRGALDWNLVTNSLLVSVVEPQKARVRLEEGVLGAESESKQNTWGCCCLHPWRRKVNRRKGRHVWARCGWRKRRLDILNAIVETLRSFLEIIFCRESIKFWTGDRWAQRNKNFKSTSGKQRGTNVMCSRRRNSHGALNRICALFFWGILSPSLFTVDFLITVFP